MTAAQPRLEVVDVPEGYTLTWRERRTRNARGRPATAAYPVAERSHGSAEAGLASVRTGVTGAGLVIIDRYYRDADEDLDPPADVLEARALGISLAELRGWR
ncbi:MAG: hypothetical protein ACF8PN_05000 [Phycisphaerales bacterium]